MIETATIPPAGVPKTSHIELPDFFTHFRHSNPFEANRVTDPEHVASDVLSINEKPYRELMGLVQHAHNSRCGIGAVVWGEAGVGKSHLLGRVCTSLGQDGCYVFLHNIQASPQRLARYVLKCVIGRLTDAHNGDLRKCRLYRLVGYAVKLSVGQRDRVSMDEAAAAFRDLTDKLVRGNPCAIGDDHRAVYDVLFRFFSNAYGSGLRDDYEQHNARLAVRWLSGDTLDQDETEMLAHCTGLGSSDGAQLADDQAVESVLMAVAELAALSSQSFVLLFDQFDNLTDERVSALARFSHTLIDHMRNLLVITAGVQERMDDFVDRNIIGASSWDRIAQEKITLCRIQPADARRLLTTRLDDYLKKYVQALPPIQQKVASDGLFPLGSEWLKKQMAEGVEFSPRRIINWAKTRWRQQIQQQEQLGPDRWLADWPNETTRTVIDDEVLPPQTAPIECDGQQREKLIDSKVDDKLKEQEHRRALDRGALPADALNLCGLTEQLLRQCVGTDHVYSIVALEEIETKPNRQCTFDLLAYEATSDGVRRTTGVKFLATGSKQSMTAALKRLANDRKPPDNVLVVTEERLPLQVGAVGTRHLEKLFASQSFRSVQLSFDDYARLDALQAVVGESRSGDLEVDLPNGQSSPVKPDEVIESHHRQDRYRRHVLLHELLTEEAIEDSKPENVLLADEDDLKQFIAAQLALTMGASSVELAVKYTAVKGLPQGSRDGVKETLEHVALSLHREGVINASPQDDHLYLLYRAA